MHPVACRDLHPMRRSRHHGMERRAAALNPTAGSSAAGGREPKVRMHPVACRDLHPMRRSRHHGMERRAAALNPTAGSSTAGGREPKVRMPQIPFPWRHRV